MHPSKFIIREPSTEEYGVIGALMVEVYSQLEGFPTPAEQPKYYEMLSNVGSLTENPHIHLLAAYSPEQGLAGCVLYIGDMQYYGSGGTATQIKDSSGFRLLAVAPDFRGQGIGGLLTRYCIERARKEKRQQLIIHSTKAMLVAWRMYERMGFERSEDLDFRQGTLEVYGFRLPLGD